jgi:hypothetical protein
MVLLRQGSSCGLGLTARLDPGNHLATSHMHMRTRSVLSEGMNVRSGLDVDYLRERCINTRAPEQPYIGFSEDPRAFFISRQ